jgi:3-hydroxyacyl-[acyl-carrier-protein] dehydratase
MGIFDPLNAMCYTNKSIEPITRIQHVDGMITACIQLPADSIWFDGHFPEMAILPGVAQLAMIVEVLNVVLGKPVRVTDVSRVRFKQAIMPAEQIDVLISPKENDPLTYGFRLSKGREMASSGFIKVARV